MVVEPTSREIPETLTLEARQQVRETTLNGDARVVAFLDGKSPNVIDRTIGVQ